MKNKSFKKTTNLIDFLEIRKVVDQNDCWIWQSNVSKGYGMVGGNWYKVHGKAYAHQLSYIAHKGPIGPGLHVCHKCDVPLCINPDHLWLGTAKDNVQDCIGKGRRGKPFNPNLGSKQHRSILKEEQVIEIVKLKKTGMSSSDVGHLFGVSGSCINDIMAGRSWSHLTNLK